MSDSLHSSDDRPKSSPDDTSLLGLAAVWSEIDAPLPPKRRPGPGKHGAHRSRRQIGDMWRAPLPVTLGIGVALGLTIAIIIFLASS